MGTNKTKLCLAPWFVLAAGVTLVKGSSAGIGMHCSQGLCSLQRDCLAQYVRSLSLTLRKVERTLGIDCCVDSVTPGIGVLSVLCGLQVLSTVWLLWPAEAWPGLASIEPSFLTLPFQQSSGFESCHQTGRKWTFLSPTQHSSPRHPILVSTPGILQIVGGVHGDKTLLWLPSEQSFFSPGMRFLGNFNSQG